VHGSGGGGFERGGHLPAAIERETLHALVMQHIETRRAR